MKTLSLPFKKEGSGGHNRIFQKSLTEVYLRAYDGLLYLCLRWYTYSELAGDGDSEQMEIYSLKPQKFPLNWTFVGSITVQEIQCYDYIYSDDRNKSPCFIKMKTVGTMVGVPLLFLTAYGLLIWRDIPAGMACFCVGVLAMRVQD
jgi:hypothetical protein